MHASDELNVSVMGPEEDERGSAGFWAGDKLFGFARVEESGVEALARAKQLLESS